MGRAHRMAVTTSTVTPEDEAEYGEDARVLPGAPAHVEPHPTEYQAPPAVRYAGPYIPGPGGGGGVFHGVEPEETHHDATEVSRRAREATHPVPYAPAPTLVDPVPVVIVAPDAGPEGRNSWDATTVVCVRGAAASKARGYDPHRSALVLLNTSAADGVRFGSDGMVSGTSGGLLPAGKDITIPASDALYLCADASAAGDVTVTVMDVYSIAGGA